jgi:hypothetical protein
MDANKAASASGPTSQPKLTQTKLKPGRPKRLAAVQYSEVEIYSQLYFYMQGIH